MTKKIKKRANWLNARALILLATLGAPLLLGACFEQDAGNALDKAVPKSDDDLASIGNSAILFDSDALDFGDVAISPSYSEKVVTLTNSTKVKLYINSFATDNAVFTVSSTDCALTPLPLYNGESCHIVIRFTPSIYGRVAANVTASYGVKETEASKFQSILGLIGSSTENPLGNTGLSVNPSQYDFGDVPVAPSFGEATFTVTNATSHDIFMGAVSTNNPLFALSLNNCPGSTTALPAAGTCQVKVRFTPLSDGHQLGYLSFAYGPDTPRAGTLQTRVALSGRSTSDVVGNSPFAFDPGYWDFGDIAAGQTSTKTVQITNARTTPIYVNSIASDNPLFTITGNTCPAGANPMAASGTCNITVRFAPTADGANVGNMVVRYGPDQARNGASRVNYVVAGRSTTTPLGNSAVVFTPAYWDFGDIASGNTASKDVVIKNNGASPIYIASIVRSSSTVFTLDASACPLSPTPLAAGATCTATMGFAPTIDGGFSSDLTVSYGPDVARANNLQTRSVFAGRSTATPQGNTTITFNPTFYDFGDVASNVSVATQITVQNTGTAPIFISGITRSSTTNFAVTHNCPSTALAVNASCTANVTFTPNGDGGYASDIIVAYGPDAARSANLKGKMSVTGRSTANPLASTSVSFTPSFWDFGDIASGQNSVQSFTITNNGSNAVFVGGTSSDNPLFAVTGSTCPTGSTTLSATASCTVSVRFSPAADGVQNGTIQFSYGQDLARATSLKANLVVIGRSKAAPNGNSSLTFNPAYWDFGDTARNTTSTKNVIVTNVSTDPVVISNITNTNSSLFSASSSNCPASPATLAAGGTCTITTTFTPNNDGPQTSDVTVAYGPDVARSNNLNAKLTLLGRSTLNPTGNVQLSFNPNFWDFGDIAASTTSTKTITISNSPASAVYLSGLSSDNALFTIASTTCPTGGSALSASGTCTMTLQFAPLTSGAQTANIDVVYGPDAAHSTNLHAKVAVYGRSTATTTGNTSVSFNPSYWDFGDVARNATSNKDVVVTNTSSAAIYISSVTRSNSSIYSTSNNCPQSPTALAPNATCTITVSFTPVADGPQASNVTLVYGPDAARASSVSDSFSVAGRSTLNPTGNAQIAFNPVFWDFGDIAANATSTKTVVVSNSSAGPVYISGISADNANFGISSTTCPTGGVALAASASCNLTLLFAPTGNGTQSSTVDLVYGPSVGQSTNLHAKLPLYGRSTASGNGNSALTFSPDYWDFGDVARNATDSKTFTVTNSTSSAIFISGVSRSNTSIFTVSNSCPASPSSLASGASCTVTVNFTPTADGAQASNITVTYGPDAPRSGNLTSVFSVSGRSTSNPAGNTRLSFSPNFWDFGDIAASSTASKSFTITNSGSDAVFISGTSSDNSVFTITSTSCPNSSTPLSSSASCTINVQFAPTAPGAQSAAIDVAYGPDAGHATNLHAKLAVSGRSTAAQNGNSSLAFNPSFWDFGDVARNTTSSKVVTVTNSSAGPVYISNVSRTNTSLFAITNGCPSSPTALGAGASCTVTVGFTPTADGAQSSDVSVIYGPDAARSSNTTSTFSVGGRSTSNPAGNTFLSFTPNFWDFGDIAASQTGTKSFTVTNAGTGNVYISGSTTDNAIFTVTSSSCPNSSTALSPSSSCTLIVQFAPTATGAQSGNVDVAYGPDSGHATNLHAKLPVYGRTTVSQTGNTALSYSPSSWDFGDVARNTTANKAITLTNSSSSPIYISGVTRSNTAVYAVSNNCPASPAALQNGASCTVSVAFTPTADGAQTSDIVVAYGPDAPRSANLSSSFSVAGRSTSNPTGNTQITFNPAFWDFGDIAVSASTTKTVTITNSGTDAIYVSGNSVDNSVFSVISSTCPASSVALSPSASCNVVVQFSPTATGAQTGVVDIAYGPDTGHSSNIHAKLSVYGRSTASTSGNSSLAFTPSYWDFGDIARYQTATKSITITNSTTSVVFISNITRSNSSLFTVSNTCPISPNVFVANASCTVTVAFTPTADGAQSSDVSVVYGPDQARSSSVSDTFSVSGRSTSSPSGNTQLTFNPTFWDFGDIAANATASKAFTVTNSGTDPIYFSGPSSDNATFTVTANSCPTGSNVLAPSVACNFTVQFAPTASGAQTAAIDFAYGPDQARNANVHSKLSLYGRSTASTNGNSSLTFTPAFYDFGDIARYQSAANSFTVTNSSSSPVYLSAVTRTNTNVFTVSNTCPVSPSPLGAGLTCTVSVTFTPNADGAQASVVSVAYGPDALRSSSTQATFSVAGRSTAAPTGNTQLSFTPTYWDFGDIAAGANSSKTIAISNVGSDSVFFGSNSSDNALYTITASTCPSGSTPLVASGSCNLTVRFAPTADGGQTAVIDQNYGPDPSRASNLHARLTVAGRSTAAPNGNDSIQFSPTFWDFGDVAANQTSSKAITISNASASPIYISGITRTNTSIFSQTNTCPTSPSALNAGAVCTVTVTFAPTADGGQTSDFSVAYGPDAARSANLTSKVSVAGRSTAAPAGNAKITFNPANYDFGDIAAGDAAQNTFTLTNASSDIVYISGFASDNAKFTIVSNTCPASTTGVSPGSGCQVVVRFAPTADGVQAGNVTVSYGPDTARAANLKSTLPVTGRSSATPTGTQAITFSPNYWDFGDVAQTVTVQKDITVTNSSAAAIYLSGVTRTNTSVYAVSSTCPASPTGLAAGGTCTVTVSFTPAAEGAQASTVTVAYGPDAARSGNLSAKVSVSGRSSANPAGNSRITFDPVFYDFGDIASGNNATNSFLVTNSGTDPIFISGLASDNAKFTITANSCPTGATSLSPSGSCNVTVRFAPTAEGVQSGNVALSYGPDQARNANLRGYLPVYGRSTAAPNGNSQLTFSPTFHSFGNIPPGNSTQQTVSVTNSSATAVVLGSITRTNTSIYSTSHNCPISPSVFSPSASCTITVTFAPTADGAQSSDISVAYGPDAARSSNIVDKFSVAGYSVTNPVGNTQLSFSPSFWDFGDKAASSSTSKVVTITNSNAGPAYFSSIASDNAVYAISANTCPSGSTALAASGTCSYTVTFTPTADGAQAGNVTVSYGQSSSFNSSLTTRMSVTGRSTANPLGNTSIVFSPTFWDFGDTAAGQTSTKVINVTNSSGFAIYMGGFSIDNALYFISSTTCPSGSTALNAGTSCSITVRYSPTTTGTDTGTITANYGPDQGRNTATQTSLSVAGRSTSGGTGNVALTYGPTFWDFGDVAANVTVNKAFTLTNTTAAPIYIGNQTRTNGTIFGLSSDCPTSPTALAASASCTVTMTFSPTADGAQTSTGTIWYGPDTARATTLTAPVVVSGRSTAAATGNTQIGFTPSYINYGDVAAGQVSDQIVTITNNGSTLLYLSSPLTSDNGTFIVLPPPSSACPTGSTPLASGATCNFKLRFAPVADGAQNANIALSYGPDQARNANLITKLVVTGRSTAAGTGNLAVTYNPTTWDFGDVAAGVQVSKAVTITNSSAAPIYISGLTRTNTSIYSVTHNCPISPTALAASGTCTATVYFQPSADGGQTSDLSLAYGPDAPRSANLVAMFSVTGRSTAAATGNSQLSFAPSYHDYGDVASGQTSLKGVTVINSGSTALFLSGASLDNAKFTVTANTCPTGATSLASGGNCVVTVRFAPTADGGQDAALSVNYGPDQARNANLVGKSELTGRSTASPIGNAALTYSPNYYDFGDVAQGVTASQAIIVTNTSTAALYLAGVSVNNPIYRVTDNCPRSPSALGAGVNCTATVSFIPTADGGQATDMFLNFGPDAARASNIISKMSLAGRSTAIPEGNPGIAFNPTFYDYDNVTAGSNASTVIQVSNTSTHPLYLGTVSVSGTAEIAVTSSNCPSGATALAASANCNLTVKYTPASQGSVTGSLQVFNGLDVQRANNTVAKATVFGRSVPVPLGNSAIQLNPNNWDFGNVALTPSYSDKVVTVTNNSTQTVFIGSITGLASPYSVASTTCPIVGSGATTGVVASDTCTITVRFSPVSGAQASMTMNVNYGQTLGAPNDYVTSAALTGKSNPVAPSNYVLTSNTATSISFGWTDNSFDESGFEIQRCDGAACDTTFTSAAGVTVAANSTSYTWTGLSEGALHAFRIRSVVGATASTWLTGGIALSFGGITSYDNGTGQASSVSGINCSTTSPGAYVALNWTSVPNASYYQIFDADVSPPFVTNVNAPASGVVLTALAANSHHSYYVQAVASLNSGNNVNSVNTTNSPMTTTYYSPCLVVGQSSPTAIDFKHALQNPANIAIDGSHLYVADYTNNRVLIWNGLPTDYQTPPSVVLGQPDFTTNTSNYGGISAKAMSGPHGVWSDGTKLYVADSLNHRVLIWNTIPTSNYTAADVVLGQTSMTGKAAATTASRMNSPAAVWSNGTKLMVADRANHRVLIWYSVPTSNGTAATSVLGQTAMTTATTGLTSSTFNNPYGVWSDGSSYIFVADYSNSRVLQFAMPANPTLGPAAISVIGQALMTTNTAGTTATTFNTGPIAIWGNGSNTLYVADYNNGRVLYYSSAYASIPANSMAATYAIGPANLTSSGAALTQAGMSNPRGLAGNGSLLYVGNWGYHRVTSYNLPLVANGTLAKNNMLGQSRYITQVIQPAVIDSSHIGRPWGVFAGGGKLAAVDAYNNRLMLWNTMPVTNLPPADVVWGQTGVTLGDVNQGGTVSSLSLSNPRGVWTDGTRLMVADTGNNRVLIWKTWPTSKSSVPDYVLGQTALNVATNNSPSISTGGLSGPQGVFMVPDGGGNYRIWVVDTGNRRIVYYTIFSLSPNLNGLNTPGITNTPNGVVGQSTLATATANAGLGGVTTTGFADPRSLWTDGTTQFIVSDSSTNNRVMIWNTIPGAMTQAAAVVGQPDNHSTGVNNPALSDATMNLPMGVWSNGTKLWVADQANHRILTWDNMPTVDGQPADSITGQSNSTLNAVNNSLAYPLANTFAYPSILWGDGSRLFISDGYRDAAVQTQTNNRITVMPAP